MNHRLRVSMNIVLGLLRTNGGGSNAEYALILGIVGTSIVLAALLLGDITATTTNEAATCIASAGSTCPDAHEAGR